MNLTQEELAKAPGVERSTVTKWEIGENKPPRPVANWSLVRNQLLLNDRLATLFDKFDR